MVILRPQAFILSSLITNLDSHEFHLVIIDLLVALHHPLVLLTDAVQLVVGFDGKLLDVDLQLLVLNLELGRPIDEHGQSFVELHLDPLEVLQTFGVFLQEVFVDLLLRLKLLLEELHLALPDFDLFLRLVVLQSE